MTTLSTPVSRTFTNAAPATVPSSPVPLALVGLGAIGQAAARAARQRAGLTIMAAADADPAKQGSDVGTLVDDKAWGIPIAGGIADLPAASPAAPLVALHTTGSFLEDVAPQILALVARGLHVVSSTEELSYPWLKHPDIAREIDAAARRQGVAVVGVGVNPGFAMDALPATLSGAAQDVRFARVVRVVDTSRRRLNLQRKTGSGMTVTEFQQQIEAGRMGHIGLAESCALLAAALGWRVDRVIDEISPIVADRPLRSSHLEVPIGRVAGLHQIASGQVGDRTVVELDLTMALGGVDDVDKVHLEGTPSLDLVVTGGLPGDLATVAALLNAVPAIVQAAPGLHTVLDLPLPHLYR